MALYVPVVTPDGILWVQADELEWHERSAAATHLNRITQALATGDYSPLRDFQGVRLGGLPLATESETLEDLDDRGELMLDAFYWEPGREPQ
jgi:hypothetical protein